MLEILLKHDREVVKAFINSQSDGIVSFQLLL